MNESVVISGSTSKCTARLARQVKTIAHHFVDAEFPRVFLFVTCHGPNTSRPISVKGGTSDNLVSGRVAITGYVACPRIRLQVVQFDKCYFNAARTPMM